MKRFAVILAGVLTAIALFAQLPPGAKPPGEDWVQIFNGKDLTGWHNVGVEQWTVEPDHSVRGKAVTKNYGYLETVQYYRDFQLALKFKCVEMGLSLIHISAPPMPGRSGRETPAVSQSRLETGGAGRVVPVVGRHQRGQ